MAGKKQDQGKSGKPKSAGRRASKTIHYYDNVYPARKLRRQLVHLLTYVSVAAAEQHAKAAGDRKILNNLFALPRFENLLERRALRRDRARLRRAGRREEKKHIGGKQS